jgi:oligopeptide transport system substrate-binding protein
MPFAERRAQARKLLQDAGYGPHNPLRFEFTYRGTGDSRIAAAIQADWRDIGAVVALHGIETQIHYNNMRAKNYDIGDGGWVGDYADPQNYLYLLETSAGSQNYPGYSSAQYDALMAQADREADVNARAALMAKAEQVMLDDDPIIPIAIGSSRNLVDPRLTGFADNIADMHRARWMCVTG